MKNAVIRWGLLGMLWCSGLAYGDAALSVQKSKVPTGFLYEGNVVQVVGWSDARGENRLLLTEAPKDAPKPALFAYHLHRQDSTRSFQLLWKLSDFVQDCAQDSSVYFIAPPWITDLDRDGVAESTLLYVSSCNGGVDGKTTKLIMHAGQMKYAIRGISGDMEGHPSPKAMKIDPSFKSAPASLREFALKLWKEKVSTKYPQKPESVKGS